MIFDLQGNYIPWGSVERVRTEPFIATATLPSFLSVYNSAQENNKWSLGPAATTTQYLQIDTATTAGSFSVLNINDNRGIIDSAGGSYALDQMEIRLGLDGLVFSHDETMMDFEFDFNAGTTRGVKLIASATGVVFQARNFGALTSVPINYWILQQGEWARPRNIEFIARPDRWVLLRENGKVVAAHQFTAAEMALGVVSPKPAVFNRVAGTARYLRLSQVALTLCH